ncbi:MAG TPA: Uma2 family endonuclease [Kofleriaceae bacterium]|nr:Uma2 family endonuclease [Kofleriaceae bacterium]
MLNAPGIMEQMADSARKATAADLLATFGEDSRVEIIHGELVEKAMSRVEHGEQQHVIAEVIGRRFRRSPGGKWPGGWRIFQEVHVQYESQELFCHDICGYRRDSEIPKSWPSLIRPDWVCELLSPRHEKRDLHDKWQVLQRAAVPHYWIVHPEEKFLRVFRLENGRYSCVLTATSGELIRAEPFDAVELRASVLFGDEDDDE